MFEKNEFVRSILNWYHLFGRKNFPWQQNKKIYNIWISEIMLQQTKANTVIPYFKKFIKKYPNLKILSYASLNDLLYIWNGLGYYKRAKYIYESTIIINKKYNGKFPKNYLNILSLPGIGKSTAGAILSLSLNYHFPILDANIKRILIRIYQLNKNNNKEIWKIINKLIPIHNTGKFNQAMMDIGATICTYNKPKCIICPIKKYCLSYKDTTIEKKFKIKKIRKIKKIYVLLIKKKNFFFLKKNNKINIWKKLFLFPIFLKKEKIFLWIKKKYISSYKLKDYKTINYKISNIILKIKPILINIKSKKILKINTNKIWYNTKKPIKIAIPKTIKKILYMI